MLSRDIHAEAARARLVGFRGARAGVPQRTTSFHAVLSPHCQAILSSIYPSPGNGYSTRAVDTLEEDH